MTNDQQASEIWSTLRSAALLGTERKPFALQTGAADGVTGLLARIDQQDSEKALLDAAAAVALYRQAGWLPASSATPLPEPCAAEDLPYCGPRAIALLRRTLTNEYAALRAEWLAAAARARRIVPPEHLAALLDAESQGLHLDDLLAVIGQRGRWLAARNPAWDKLTGAEDDAAAWDEIWQTGSRATRVRVLTLVRGQDPARARQMIADVWSAEKADDRAAFLDTLTAGLSMDDEPFLEAALDDRGKEVRRRAADLLAQLPESRLIGRMIERLTPLLALKEVKRAGLMGALGSKKLQIEVMLPEKCDATMQRDGIEQKSPNKEMGDRAWWLAQMLAVVPPAHWNTYWGKTAAELTTATLGGDWHLAVMRGWTDATLRWYDQTWGAALLAQAPDDAALERSSLQWISLIAQLPQDRWEAWVIERLQGNKDALNGSNPVLRIITQRRAWSTALSRQFLLALRREVSKGDSARSYQLGYQLKTMALSMPPTIFHEAEGGWPTDATQWRYWSDYIGEFLNILQLRAEIMEEFSR